MTINDVTFFTSFWVQVIRNAPIHPPKGSFSKIVAFFAGNNKDSL